MIKYSFKWVWLHIILPLFKVNVEVFYSWFTAFSASLLTLVLCLWFQQVPMVNNLAHDSCVDLLWFLLFQFQQFSFISNESKRKFTSAFSLRHLETSNCWEQPCICEWILFTDILIMRALGITIEILSPLRLISLKYFLIF